MSPVYNPEVFGYTPGRITTGTYAGNSTANRAIPHGLYRDPLLVVIMSSYASDDIGDSKFHIMNTIARIFLSAGGVTTSLGVTVMDGTNFYVGSATDYANTANNTGYSYVWVAIG
jgi:hypothetical protein